MGLDIEKLYEIHGLKRDEYTEKTSTKDELKEYILSLSDDEFDKLLKKREEQSLQKTHQEQKTIQTTPRKNYDEYLERHFHSEAFFLTLFLIFVAIGARFLKFYRHIKIQKHINKSTLKHDLEQLEKALKTYELAKTYIINDDIKSLKNIEFKTTKNKTKPKNITYRPTKKTIFICFIEICTICFSMYVADIYMSWVGTFIVIILASFYIYDIADIGKTYGVLNDFCNEKEKNISKRAKVLYKEYVKENIDDYKYDYFDADYFKAINYLKSYFETSHRDRQDMINYRLETKAIDSDFIRIMNELDECYKKDLYKLMREFKNYQNPKLLCLSERIKWLKQYDGISL